MYIDGNRKTVSLKKDNIRRAFALYLTAESEGDDGFPIIEFTDEINPGFVTEINEFMGEDIGEYIKRVMLDEG